MGLPGRKPIPLMGGHNSKVDEGFVGVNQLVATQGVEYKDGDPEIIHKIPGRSIFGTVASVGKVQGLVLATYDDGTTFLLAVGGQQLYYADASNGTTGTFTVTVPTSGTRNPGTTKMTGAHFNNRWFIATGEDSNLVVEADAAVVDHGMYAPNSGNITITTVAVGVQNNYLPVLTTSHTVPGGSWYATSVASGAQTSDDFAAQPHTGIVMTGQSQTASIQYEATITNTWSGRLIEVQYNFGDDNNQWFGKQPGDNSDPADTERPWEATLDISYSTNSGSSFVTHEANVFTRNLNGIQTTHIEIADGTATEDIRVKFEVAVTSLTGLLNLTFKLYAVRLTDGSGTVAFTNEDGAMWYAITEWDEKREWESALSDPAIINQGVAAFGSVQVSLPASARTNNATHYKIYRTSNQNTSFIKSEMGYVGQAKVGATTFRDTFFRWLPSEIPTDPSYEWLILDEFGEESLYEINTPPPPLEFIGNFKGAMFGLKNRTYYQSLAGRPNQWPKLFTIERMPFKEHSPLKAGLQIGEVLWIGTEAGVIILDHPIETRSGSLRLPAPRRLEGAPGCTGAYAATPLSFGGESLVAWISNHGIIISNMATFDRITEDIDWEGTVTEASLSSAVLFWREKKQQLVMLYDSTGNGDNDSFMLIHMGSGQKAPTQRPLITLGHPGKFTYWTGGRIGGVWKEFTCDVGDNQVYLEGGSATKDFSLSYNGSGDIPADIKTGRQYFSTSVDVGRSQLFTSLVASTVSLTIGYTTGRDDDIADRTAEFLMAISGSRSQWRNFQINQSGDFMQWRFQTVGQVAFSLGPVAPWIDGDDPQGIIE